MPRMNGERQQDYEARRRAEIERVVETRAWYTKRALMVANGVQLPTAEVPVPCPCEWLPFPHYHRPEHAQAERVRFEQRREPFLPTWREEGVEVEP